MARTKSQRADEDALDPVEAADVEHADDADAGLLELDPEAELDDADDNDDEVDDEVDTDASDGDDAPADPAPLDTDANETDEHDVAGVVVLPDAAFDDDDDVAAAVIDDDDDDDEIEGVRDGEFVCRRCYMAMRETQLADAERLLCRDCA